MWGLEWQSDCLAPLKFENMESLDGSQCIQTLGSYLRVTFPRRSGCTLYFHWTHPVLRSCIDSCPLEL